MTAFFLDSSSLYTSSKEILSILFLVSFFIILLFFLCCKDTKFKISRYVIFIYLCSSVFSFIFYFEPYAWERNQLTGNISFGPFIYWEFFFIVALVPVFKFDFANVQKMGGSPHYLDRIIILVSIISIPAFFEQVYLVVNDAFFSADYAKLMVELHDNSSLALDRLSLLSRWCLRINVSVYELSFVCLIIYFSSNNKNKKIIFYCFFIILTRNLTGLITGHRAAVVDLILKLILVVFFCYPLLNNNEKEKIKKYIIIVLFIAFTLLFALTVARQSHYSISKSKSFSLSYFMSWYLGEGLLNFNQFLPFMKNTSDGEFTFWFFLNLFGSANELTHDYLYFDLYEYMGIPTNIFYTFIGDFVRDFGFLFAGIFVIFLSLFVNIITTPKCHVFSIEKLYLLFIYISFLQIGFIGNCFKGEHSKFLLVHFVIFIFLKICKKNIIFNKKKYP